MKRLLCLLALIAILVPVLAGQFASPAEAQDAPPASVAQSFPGPALGFDPGGSAPFDTLQRARQPGAQNQVRIERRIVIRIGPAARQARSQMLSELPRREMRTRYAEEEHDDCIDARSVVGVHPGGDNRLLFFTRDDSVIAATLENGCAARAFYAGFYIERSDDERLCVARDRLQSRAGASCQVDGFSRLVAVAN